MDSAKRTASDLAKQGKRQADLLAAQNKLAKIQRQLGILVYDLARKGEENPLLVKKYIAAIAAIEAEIRDLKGGHPMQENAQKCTLVNVHQEPEAVNCPQCGAEVQKGAMFCSSCGAQL